MTAAMTESTSPTVVPPVRILTAPAWRNPWLYVALALVALVAWQWMETRARLADTRQELARRLADSDAAGREERGALKQALEQVAALQAKVGALEAQQDEFQGQSEALQNLYQELASRRDEATLLEVEQAVTLAAQQLQLAGNVQAAVLALQSADARLAALGRPQFMPLRKALAQDLDRLRAVPFVDVPGMSLRLENVLLAVDKLPLAMDQRPAPEKPAAAPTGELPWWQRLGGGLWQEIKGMVRVQRFDRAEPVLLAPGQDFFLRENLKLRLLNARLALLSRDAWTFRNELKAAQEALSRHFDGNDKAVQAAQAGLKQLAATELNIELPNLNNSLNALRGLRNTREKK